MTVSGGTLQINPVVGSPTLSSLPGGAAVTNNATVTINAPNTVAGTVSGTGTLNVGDTPRHGGQPHRDNRHPGDCQHQWNEHPDDRASSTPNAPAVVSTIGTLNVGSGTLDVTNNGVILPYAAGNGATAALAVRNEIISGLNGGTWTGPGITSSTAAAAAANVNTVYPEAVGYADTSTLYPGGGTFLGQSVGGSNGDAIVVRWTLLGDANLDGKVNATDLAILRDNYNTRSGGTWQEGDFAYNGKVNASDLADIRENYGKSVNSVVSDAVTAMHKADALHPTGIASAAVHAPPSGKIELVVNTITGDAQLEGNTTSLSIYEIDSNGSLVPGNLITLASQYPSDGFSTYGSDQTIISEGTTSNGPSFTGVFNIDLGDIYKPGDPQDLTLLTYNNNKPNQENDFQNSATTSGTSVIYTTGTPEPATLGLLAVSTLGLLARRRRRRCLDN